MRKEKIEPAGIEMTIGQLAAAVGVTVEAIRYYQREHLMPIPERRRGAIRHYGERELKRLRFIKRAQALGFTLEEVRNLLKLEDGAHCAETREIAAAKLAVIDAKLRDLQAMRHALSDLVAACTFEDKAMRCPLIDTLSRTATHS